MAADPTPFLFDLALVTGLAAVTTLVFHRFRQPVVVGYILAGVLVGPHSPLLRLQSVESVNTLAELGIVFLMFSIGLEFRLRRLARAGLAATGAALASMVVVALATLLVARAAGWSANDALFMAAILAISSTVIAAKAILERGQMNQRWADLAMGILIVQDVAAVVILAILGAGSLQQVELLGVLGVLGRLATFAMAALVLGLLVVPRVVNKLVRQRADEVLVVLMVGLALGTAVLALLLGFSPALGAFLMGAVVAEASEAWGAAQRVLPLRDLFTAVFFVSIGMLLDPALLAAYWVEAVVFAVLMVTLKVVVHTVAAFLLRTPSRDAFRASLAVGQMGEFSFVIAALGLSLGAVSGFVLPITVAIATASALWAPYFLRGADPLYDALARRLPAGLGATAARYQAWIGERVSPLQRLRASTRRHARRSLLNAAAMVLILLATAAASKAAEDWIVVRGLTDRTLALLPWLAGGVVALPFGFNSVRYAWSLAAGLSRARTGAPQGLAPPRSALRSALLVLGPAGLVFAVFLAAAPFLPPLPLLLLSFAAFLGAAIVLWETVGRLHARIADALEGAMGGVTVGEERVHVLETLQGEYSLGVEVVSVQVELGTSAAGVTVRGLDLRARTGATLFGVRRGGRAVVNPAPGYVVEAGDVLLLLGEPEQLERARAVLHEASPEVHGAAPPRLVQVQVEEGSPLAGQTLAASALGERTGAMIVGIVRGGRRLPSPGGATRLEPGDALLVVGSEAEVGRAVALARAAGSGPAEDPGAQGPNV